MLLRIFFVRFRVNWQEQRQKQELQQGSDGIIDGMQGHPMQLMHLSTQLACAIPKDLAVELIFEPISLA